MSAAAGEDLSAKLLMYQGQLDQIRKLLSQDPSNGELRKLETDLLAVIEMTSSLRTQAKEAKKEAKKVARAGAQGHGSSASSSSFVVGGGIGGAGSAGSSSTSPSSSSSSSSSSPSSSPLAHLRSVRAGMCCDALFDQDGKWYPAWVKLVDEDALAGGQDLSATHTVVFLGFGNELAVGASTLRALRPAQPSLTAEQLPTGSECEALYHVDRTFYAATVEAHTPHGFRVKFTQYGNVEEVPLQYIRRAGGGGGGGGGGGATAAGGVAAGAAGGAGGGAGGIHAKLADGPFIPEALIIHATDTEEEKARKKKKIKAIKSKHRVATKEHAINEKKSSWQSFQTKKKKVGKKTKTGFFSGQKKQSMFRTGDGFDARVGVIGSGQGMTDFDGRKKHKPM